MATEVLQVITTTARRGAECFAVALEPELVDRGFSVRTVALCAAPSPGLNVETLGTDRLGFSTLRALRSAASDASVVVAHGSTTLPATAIATAGCSTPFVYRNIGDPTFWMGSTRRRLTSRALLSRADKVVALSAETGRRLESVVGVRHEHIVSIPTGVSAAGFPKRSDEDRRRARVDLGLDLSTPVAIWVGALSPEKDVLSAIRSVAHMPPEWQLLIVGDGSERARAEQEAAALGAGRVHFLGQRSDPASVMNAADLLLLSSRTEGLPGVVIEAGMVGLPAVVTDVGVLREIVDHGRTGFVVPAGDPEALGTAVALAALRLAELGEAAHARVSSQFSLSVVADAWSLLLRHYVSPAIRVPEVSSR